MGYSYDMKGRLSCDSCGECGGVRKIACPFGYCQAPALCAKCKTKHADKLTKAAHREQGCERKHNEFAAELAEDAAIKERGGAVRCAALTCGNGKVHVLFGKTQGCVGFFMDDATYHAEVPRSPTPDDYRKHGELTPAPDDFLAPGGAYELLEKQKQAMKA